MELMNGSGCLVSPCVAVQICININLLSFGEVAKIYERCLYSTKLPRISWCRDFFSSMDVHLRSLFGRINDYFNGRQNKLQCCV